MDLTQYEIPFIHMAGEWWMGQVGQALSLLWVEWSDTSRAVPAALRSQTGPCLSIFVLASFASLASSLSESPNSASELPLAMGPMVLWFLLSTFCAVLLTTIPLCLRCTERILLWVMSSLYNENPCSPFTPLHRLLLTHLSIDGCPSFRPQVVLVSCGQDVSIKWFKAQNKTWSPIHNKSLKQWQVFWKPLRRKAFLHGLLWRRFPWGQKCYRKGGHIRPLRGYPANFTSFCEIGASCPPFFPLPHFPPSFLPTLSPLNYFPSSSPKQDGILLVYYLTQLWLIPS